MDSVIKPYYERPGITIYHADCLNVLPQLSGVDAVIADPPYGCNYRQGDWKTGGKWIKKHVNVVIRGDNTLYDPIPLLQYPVVVLFGANHYADKLPASRGWIFWDKIGTMLPNDFGDGELIWTNQDRVIRKYSHYWRGVIRESENGGTCYHPTQKPVVLMEWLIEQFTAPGDLVLDPYMGSGTTGVACIKTGRRFIGIEIEEKYCEIAVKRLQQCSFFELPEIGAIESVPIPKQVSFLETVE